MLHCPMCNSAVQEGTRFCPTCNADLSGYMQQPQASMMQSGVQQPYGYQPARRATRSQMNTVQVCQNCGRPLQPGQVCACRMSASGQMQSAMVRSQSVQPLQQSTAQPPVREGFRMPDMGGMKDMFGQSGSLLKRFWYHIGAGDPELDRTDAYEKKLRIVPDTVTPAEGEIAIRQYEICRLSNRFLGFELNSADGRLQVTTNRVIFRAPGRGLEGRTVQQHEFNVNDVVGMEARKYQISHIGDLLVTIVIALILTAVIMSLSLRFYSISGLIVSIFGMLGVALFAVLHKQWRLKSVTTLGPAVAAIVLGMYPRGSILEVILGVILLALSVFSLVFYTIRPEMELVIRTRTGEEVISVRRGRRHGGTGFNEVFPSESIYSTIREAMAIVCDVQNMGNQAAEKWGRM